MQQIFWRKWSSSYLSLLQERKKWQKKGANITCGTNQPTLKWIISRVSEVIFGEDGVTRFAVVSTNNGLIKRAVTKLSVLSIESFVEGSKPQTAGV